jgi:hypothetical protein
VSFAGSCGAQATDLWSGLEAPRPRIVVKGFEVLRAVVAAAVHSCRTRDAAGSGGGRGYASAARILYHALEMTLFLRHLYSIALATAVSVATGSSTEAEK